MLHYTAPPVLLTTRSTKGHILAVAINTKHCQPQHRLVTSKWHSGEAKCWREFVVGVADVSSWQQAIQINQSVPHQ